MNRPQLNDNEIYRAVARELVECTVNFGHQPPPLDDVVALIHIDGPLDSQALEKVFGECWPIDGVDGLIHRIGEIHHCIHEEAVKCWVRDNHITLSLEVGSAVQTPRGPGKIIELDPARARYVVEVEELKGSGKYHVGIFYPAEQVTPRAKAQH